MLAAGGMLFVVVFQESVVVVFQIFEIRRMARRQEALISFVLLFFVNVVQTVRGQTDDLLRSYPHMLNRGPQERERERQ